MCNWIELSFITLQDALQKMRQIDDKIIHMLNTTIPTESFKAQVDPTENCKDLYDQIEKGHMQRQIAINKCLMASKERLQKLKEKKENGEETPEVIKQLRKEQTTWRLIQSELNVEEVVRQRTMKAYYERCRSYYKPDSLKQ